MGQAGVGCYGQSLLAARHAHLKYFGVRWSGVWWGGLEVGESLSLVGKHLCDTVMGSSTTF